MFSTIVKALIASVKKYHIVDMQAVLNQGLFKHNLDPNDKL